MTSTQLVFVGRARLGNRSGMTFNEKFPTVMFQVKGSVHKITGMKFNDQVSLICVHGQIMSWT